MLIDTHAHLTWDSFKPDLGEIVGRAREAGITHVINIGADLESSSAAAKLECPGIKCYSTIGLHPHESEKNIPVKELEKIYQTHPDKIIAVGECGLDYFKRDGQITDQEKESQKALFQAQINLAKKLSLPLIIHCRPSASSGLKDAWQDIFDFDFQGVNGVFHSFTGSKETAQKALNLGFYLSFSCIVTYPKNDYLRQIIKETPLDKILVETDCPFLPPQTKRGQRCEPQDVIEVVKVIAQMKNLSLEEVAQASFQNAQTLFHFS